ncbi:MAG: hypothetical protein ACI959_001638 [Limisphaerales bacterium]|jgi:hypothetical protein
MSTKNQQFDIQVLMDSNEKKLFRTKKWLDLDLR